MMSLVSSKLHRTNSPVGCDCHVCLCTAHTDMFRVRALAVCLREDEWLACLCGVRSVAVGTGPAGVRKCFASDGALIDPCLNVANESTRQGNVDIK